MKHKIAQLMFPIGILGMIGAALAFVSTGNTMFLVLLITVPLPIAIASIMVVYDEG